MPENAGKLEFKLFSGGLISIDHGACLGCPTKACVRSCVSSTMEPVLKIVDGVPQLSRADAKTESGWCVECLACELDCALHGRGAVRITLHDEGRA